jgi:hypothetical protein
LYNLYQENAAAEQEAEQLVVLYFNNDVSNSIVSRLKIIFNEY